MKKWLRHIIEGNTFQGLEVFHLDGATLYALIKLHQKNGELHVVSEDVFRTVGELAPNVDKKHALNLVINTSQILKKQVMLDSKLKLTQKVIQAFPNLDLENFHYELLNADGLGMVSIGKKEYLNELLASFESNGIVPSMVSLGISDLGTSLPYLKSSRIQGSNFQLIKIGDAEFRFEPDNFGQESKLELNDLELSNRNLLSFSAVLGCIMGSNKKTSLKDINWHFANKFQNKRIFDFSLKWGLGLTLVVLLVNFAFYSNYHGKILNMDAGYDMEQQKERLQSTKQRIAQKEQRLDKVLGAASSKTTFYLDRIALELPNTILLDKLTFQPLLKPIRDGKVIEIEANSIHISGQSGDKLQFTQWTETLEQKKWIETVEVLNYGFASKNLDAFILKINIDEAGY